MRPGFIRRLAACLIYGASLSAASAVEILATSAQVNPVSDPVNSVFTPDVIRDAAGAFAVVWAKDGPDDFTAPEQLFIRHYSRIARPTGARLSFGGKVGGKTPEQVGILGGAGLGGGKLIAVWQAHLPPIDSREGVARFFEDGALASGVVSVEDDLFANSGPTLQLPDGRALVTWYDSTVNSLLNGRFVRPNGSLAPPTLAFDFGSGHAAPLVVPLDRGVLAYVQRVNGSQGSIVAQVYDENGQKEGGEFELIPPTQGGVGNSYLPVGLDTGEIALLRCVENPTTFRCAITGQRFRRNGAKVGSLKTLVNDAAGQLPLATAINGGGLLLTLEHTVPGGLRRLAFYRFNAFLAPVGAIARTPSKAGLRRGPIRRLANGRVAALSVVDNARLFIHLAKP